MKEDVNEIIAYRLSKADEALDLAQSAIEKNIGILSQGDCTTPAST